MLAGFDRKGTGKFAIMKAGFDTGDPEYPDGATIRFTLDRNESGTLDTGDSEDITYSWDGNQGSPLTQNGTDFIDNVTNLTFTYLDTNANDLGNPVPAANLADIRTVVITMTVQEPAGRGGPVNRTFTTRVRCRNIGL
jgi:hypothetical protein